VTVPTVDLVIEAPRAVVDGDEQGCTVLVRDGRITGVEEYGARLVAADRHLRLDEDVVLLPGLVDTHVHCNDPGRADWEGFDHATRAAAAGGVTTVVDMPLNSLPPTVDLEALAAKRAAAEGRCFVDVAFWGGAVPGNSRDLHTLWQEGVLGFKCFLVDSGVEEFPALDEAGLRTVAEVVASFGGLLLVHAEDPAAVHPPGPGPDYAAFAASRPPVAEVSAVETVVDTSRATGCRMHVVHLAAAAALPVVRAAHDGGVPVTAETCPHYLTLTASEAPAGDASYKCCPPLRDEVNRDGLWAGLLDGTLGMVVSDHSPCPPELKRTGRDGLADAWGGVSSLQLGLAATWTEARPRGHGLADVVRWMATRPAERADLWHKGQIAEGADADLCVLAPDESFVVDPARLEHRHPVTPYAGRTLTGVVRQTFLAGRPVDLDAPPRGRLLGRGGRR
jgi:allantoinase